MTKLKFLFLILFTTFLMHSALAGGSFRSLVYDPGEFDFFRTHAPQKRHTQTSLKVMTQNLWRKTSFEVLSKSARYFKEQNPELPEIILFQEVIFPDTTFARSSAHTFAHTLDTKYEIQAHGKTPSRTEGSAIASLYPIRYFRARTLKNSAIFDSKRVAVMAEVEHPILGLIRITNIHLAYAGWMTDTRISQLKETLQWISHRDKGFPADLNILGGDFNATPNSEEMAIVDCNSNTEHLSYQDFNSNEATYAYTLGTPSQRLDYLFVATKNSIRLESEDFFFNERVPLLNDFFSDHLALIHTYDIHTGSTY